MTDAYTENQERFDRKLQELIDERNELRAAAPVELGRIAAALERIATVVERVEREFKTPAVYVASAKGVTSDQDAQRIRDAIDAASRVYGAPL